MRFGGRALALMAAVTATAARGQQPPLVPQRLDSGTVIRLRFPNGAMQIGRLLEPFAPESTAFRYAVAPRISEHRTQHPNNRQTPAREVAGVDVRLRSRSGQGVAIGGGIGLGIGVLGYQLFQGHCGNCQVGVAIGAATIGGVSALIGSHVGGRSSFWRPAMELPPPARVGGTIDSGRVVRLETLDGTRWRGTLLAPVDPGSIAYRFCTYPARRPCVGPRDRYATLIAADQVQSLDVRERSRWPEGMPLGALLGVVGGIGACEGLIHASDCRGVKVIAGSALVGGTVGALVGSAFGVWRRAT